MLAKWSGRLKGHPCFILGNAPSLSDIAVSQLKDHLTIGINRAWMAGIDPTMLFWSDPKLYRQYPKEINNLKAIKVCREPVTRDNFYRYVLNFSPYRFSMKTHQIYGKGSSGPMAVQFAVALGCSPIIIAGYDCICEGEKTDFYGKNTDYSRTTMKNCAQGIRFVKSYCPVPIINLGRSDLWKRYQLEDVLNRIGDGKGRKFYRRKLLG